MSVMSGNSRTADKFVVRLSDGLRERIYDIAKGKHRSMNGQLLQWLEMCVELEEKNPLGINPDELKALLIEAQADPQGAIVMSVPHMKYTPAPATPVRVKGSATVWIVKAYSVDDKNNAIAWVQRPSLEKPTHSDFVSIAELEPA